jgi:hypothetical protein
MFTKLRKTIGNRAKHVQWIKQIRAMTDKQLEDIAHEHYQLNSSYSLDRLVRG